MNEWDRPVIRESPAQSCEAPALHDAVTALLIMGGMTTRWVHNRWIIIDRRGYRSAVPQGASFDDWRETIEGLTARPHPRRS